MALPPEKAETLREKFKRAKERRMAEMFKKFHQEADESAESKEERLREQKRKSDTDRIIGSTKKMLETTSAQQKIDPVITTKEVAVTTGIDHEIESPSSTMLITNVEDKSVQTLMSLRIPRSKCTNCCGGLPGRGPGLGQGCDRRCSCIPGLRIRETGFCDEEGEFTRDSTDSIQLPRLFVTRHRGSRLRGGGSGVYGKDSRKTKIPRICCGEEKNPSLRTQSSLRRRQQEGLTTVEDKEHRLPRRFRRSLSSPRGQLARWKEARESYRESCLRGGRSRSGKNCVGHGSVSTKCVPTSYDTVSGAPPRISKRPRKFRRKRNVMAAATVGWTSRPNKLRRRTTTSPLLALSATSKCFRKGLMDLVGNKYREYLPWETPSITFDERGWSNSSFRRGSKFFSMFGSKTSRARGRNDCHGGYSLSTEPDKTISSTSDVRLRSSTRNRFYFPLEIMIRVRHSKSCRNYNFSQQRGYSSRQVLKLERNEQERLRGGGSTFDLITKLKLRRKTNSKDRSTMDNLDDIMITPLHNDKENSVIGVTFSDNTYEDECPWSHDLTNERMQRFQEDQGCCGGSEHRNEDGRIRGGCGRSYKPVQHSYFSNASTILGRRDLLYPRSPCCPPARPQVSCRAAPAGRPPSCQRSSPICSPTRFQNHISCGRIDPFNDTEGCCPCNSCGGAACNDISNRTDISRCCRTHQKEQHPCQCKCQTCKGSRSCGGCGGQSCGRIYSCSGSGGGTCCFPRNTVRRSGPQCCGGNSNCGGCC